MKATFIFIIVLNILTFIHNTQVWLPEVDGYSDYAGKIGEAICSIRISGGIEYRVHTINKGWLPPVTGNNINDPVNGYAGIDDMPIDGIAIKDATYKVHLLGGNWLSEVNKYDINDLNYGMAGILGKKIDAIMIKNRKYAVAYISHQQGDYSRAGAVAYAKKHAINNINHECGNYLSCTPCSYFGDEHCGYSSENGGDCANFVSQCLVLGGGHEDLSGGEEICRGYPCGFEEVGAKRLGDCLVSKGWTRTCGYLEEPPSNIKAGDVLIYHSDNCESFSAHAVIITQGGSNAKIACHSNEQLDVSYTYMGNSKPFYEWLHFND